MSELKNYQSILSNKAEAVRTLFAKYPEVSSTLQKNFSEIYDSKIANVEPEIMVYGIYNAGKSSILNELMGADKAVVQDIPTTDRVDYYEWQGYKIADTPGVMAPKIHEDVTMEHLKKADVVLFVMSTTGSNEKAENYIRMKDIADAGKKIIIILNDKNGDMGKNENVIEEIKNKVYENMRRIGIEYEKFCIVTVNAKRAKKGRTENKSKLLEKSGIEGLKSVILTELKSTTSFDILRRGIKQIENILEEFIDKLEKNENSELIKNMNRVLETFKKQKISMRRQINTYIETQFEMLGDSLPQILWANREKQDEWEEIVNKEIAQISAKVQRETERQLQDTLSILEIEFKSFSQIKIDDKSVDAESFKNIMSKLSAINIQEMAIPAVISKNTFDLIPTTIGAAELATGVITEGAKEIASNVVKTEIGKTIAKSTIGKVLGAAVPLIGPILTLCTLGKLLGGNDDREQFEQQIAQQNAQERRRVEEEMQIRQELNQKCHYLADNIADNLKNNVDEKITETLTKYEEPFKSELEKRKQEGEQFGKDIFDLRKLHDEYDKLCVELGSR